MNADKNVSNELRPRRRWQFSLIGLFVVMTVAAVYLALVTQSPWLAAAMGFWLFMLYTGELLVAAGTTATGARLIRLMTVVAWMLIGALLLTLGVFLLPLTYNGDAPSLGSTMLLMEMSLVVGGLACIVAARRAARRRTRSVGRSAL